MFHINLEIQEGKEIKRKGVGNASANLQKGGKSPRGSQQHGLPDTDQWMQAEAASVHTWKPPNSPKFKVEH